MLNVYHLFIISLILLSAPVVAAESWHFQKAEQLMLSKHPYWLKLLHYRRSPFTGIFKSQADEKKFFLAESGATNPETELDANIRAFFILDDKKQQCRFPARFHWLKQQLGIEHKISCIKFDLWIKNINPETLTLIFPSAHINNPSSMFGHTLLRVNKAKQPFDTPLSAIAINYAADVSTKDNGFVFALRGILGGYPGIFSAVPYYEKIKEYNDIENRDIWEYELNLSKEEVIQLLRHVWELKDTNFDYYFFDENCSFRLLWLLDTARPGLKLTDQFYYRTIPADTVRAIIDSNLVAQFIYRPSNVTILKQHAQSLTAIENNLSYQIVTKKIPLNNAGIHQLKSENRARILEHAYDFIRYQSTNNPEKRDPNAKLAYQILLDRSQINASDVWPAITTPTIRPDQGHKTSRLAIGLIDNHESVIGIKIRPAFHDLLDLLPGYTEGAQINFLDFEFTINHDAHLKLKDFTLLNIISLARRDLLFKPISWAINISKKQINDSHGHDDYYHITVDAGVTYPLGKHHLWTGMLETEQRFSPVFAKGNDFGLGIYTGLLMSWQWTKVNLYYKNLIFMTNKQRHDEVLSWQQNFPLNRNSAIRLSLSKTNLIFNETNEYELSWQYYF